MNTAAIFTASSAPPRPSVPTRQQVCEVRHHFQGLTIHSKTYGDLPWFTAALPAMDAVGELQSTLDQLKAAGDTHCQVDFEFNYGEPGQPWGSPQLVPSRSLTNDLPTYCRIVDAVIARNLKPIFVTPDGDIAWLHANLQRVVLALGARTAYGPFQLGYDGGWPASWSVADVKALLPWVRSVIGDSAYLAMMFATNGGRPYFFVEDEQDFGKPWMQCLDVILQSSGPDQLQCPALVNGAQYMLGPGLTPHETCTPAWHGPWLLAPGTPRGPYFWAWDEWYEYQWVRNQVPLATIEADRARALSIGMQGHG